MHLTPKEIEKVLIYSMAEIALKRKPLGDVQVYHSQIFNLKT